MTFKTQPATEPMSDRALGEIDDLATMGDRNPYDGPHHVPASDAKNLIAEILRLRGENTRLRSRLSSPAAEIASAGRIS